MQCQKLEEIRDATLSKRGSAALDLEKHDVRFALRILRNALAHNNILDVPNDSDQIENWLSSQEATGAPVTAGWMVGMCSSFLSMPSSNSSKYGSIC